MISKSSHLIGLLVFLGVTCCALTGIPCKAAAYAVTLQTFSLNAGNDYTLEFRFSDGGNGTNNLATIAQLNFGSGASAESVTGFSLVDGYPNVMDVDFKAGNSITFRLILTSADLNNFQPDSFVVSLFDINGNPVNAQTGGPLLEIDEPVAAGVAPNVQTFSFPFVTVSVVPVREVAKDFDSAGYADLVWENTVTGERTIWFLKNGAYASSIYLPTVSPDWHIAGVGDFLGNGQADLVWENTVTGEHTIWFLNNGVFQYAIYLPIVSGGWHVVGAGDFNGDGYADLVWKNSITGQRTIWFLINGVYSSSIYLPTVSPDWHIAGVGDFLANGQADLVWENTVTGQHTIWILNNGVFQYGMQLPTLSGGWHIAGAGDFNGDGYADLVWENSTTGQRTIWFLANGAYASSIYLPTVSTEWQIVDH